MKDFTPLLDSVRLARIAEDLWTLVNIPSPTGDEREAVMAYAEMLRSAGAEVQVDETNPASPSVIGRLKGSRPGKTFQLAGHIDHISVPHPAPKRDEKIISGRGSADMKSGLAAILEMVRILRNAGRDFPGEILATVYGMHEAPEGDGSVLKELISRGVLGDAALVAESTLDCEGKAVIMGAGQSIWNIVVRWKGEVCHELMRPPEADSLLEVALKVVALLRAHDGAVKQQSNNFSRGVAIAALPRRRLLPPESLFIGQLHYGDFYNRTPNICSLQGTRRWHPDRDFPFVEKELKGLLACLPHPANIVIENNWTFVGEAYSIDPEETVVRAMRSAHKTVTGRDMPLAGTSVITDANRLVSYGHIPAVLCGFDNEFAHADHEFVRIEKLLQPCKVALLAALNYLELEEVRI